MIYLQYSALHRIYHHVPELSKAPFSTSLPAAPPSMDYDNSSHASGWPAWLSALHGFAGHLREYARQRSFLPGLALAMLYCTVLSFHMTMIAYLMVRAHGTDGVDGPILLPAMMGRGSHHSPPPTHKPSRMVLPDESTYV